jgi:C4-dicarboxylate transporter, DctM subunit
MSIGLVGLITAASMLSLILLGLPIAFALGLTGLGGIIAVTGGTAWVDFASGAALHNLSHFGLLAVPLFILMGTYITESGMGPRLIDFASQWFRRFPGYLHTASIVACGVFASMSGSSIATAAAIGGVILPEMKRRGHNMRYGMGAVAAGGTLGIIIPPSNAFIIYGVLTETSIAKLFIAGILPGILLVISFVAFNSILFTAKPELNPTEEKIDVDWGARLLSLRRIWTGIVLIVAVIGGIFMGVVTPTEAAGLGALVALILGIFVLKGLSFGTTHKAAVQAVQITAMVGFIIYGGLILGRGLTLLQLSHELVALIEESELNRWVVMGMINAFLLFLGMLLDAAAITLITIPLLFPVIVALGFDPIWFGVIFSLNMELALITPPVGINLFVIKGITGEKMKDVILGALPYALIVAGSIVLIMFFPGIATWLPEQMFDF